MTRKLRPYQEQARDFLLASEFGGLNIDMGLGKTAATLHACLTLPKPILLVGPIRVIETVWRQEAQEWESTKGLTFSLVRGTPAQRVKATKIPADIYLVNPEVMAPLLEKKGFKTLIIDESSQYKSSSSLRFKLLRRAIPLFERRFILTGTISPNSILDVWSQVFLLDRGEALGRSFNQFRSRFAHPVDYQRYKWRPNEGASEEVAKLISPFIFQVRAQGNLPPRQVIHNLVKVQLPPEVKRAYKEMEKDAFTTFLDSPITSATAAASMMKLRQIASGFVYGEERKVVQLHEEKIKALQTIIEETGTPVVVVYHFQHELAGLKKALPQGKIFSPDILPSWNKGEVPVMFLHPQAGGHGINLQYGGHTMVVFSASFSYELMAQTIARIDRQGQESPVVVHSLVSEDTVDELILEVLDRKAKGQEQLLDHIKTYATTRLS